MTLLSLMLAGEQASGSIATGAQLGGLATVVTGLAAPWRGRRLDRTELRQGLRRSCSLAAVALAAEAVSLQLGLGVGVLAVGAVAQGLAYAPVLGGYRALLPVVVDSADLPRANALEAVFVEVAFVSGFALSGLLALIAGPVALLAMMAMLLAVAGATTAALPRRPGAPAQAGAVAGPTVRVRVVYLLAVAMGGCLGAFEATIPARVIELGLPSAAGGPLLALTALGSGIGGVVASRRPDPSGDLRVLAAGLLAAFGLLIAPTALVAAAPALAIALLAAGIPIAPLNALGMLVLQREVAPARQTEAFSLFTAAVLMGAGAGQAVAGQLFAARGAQLALFAAGVLPLVAGGALGFVRRPGKRTAQ